VLVMQSTYVRIANDGDTRLIEALLHRAFQEFESLYTDEAFQATTRLKSGRVWVAVDANQLVGVTSAVPQEKGLYICSMAVEPTERRKGIASVLLHHVESFAIGRGFRQLFLSTTPFLTGAIRLYERFGFQRCAEEPQYLHGTPIFTMFKPLSLAFTP
jgi:ribosomal protein S18 acetylase RimI-like enzyme